MNCPVGRRSNIRLQVTCSEFIKATSQLTHLPEDQFSCTCCAQFHLLTFTLTAVWVFFFFFFKAGCVEKVRKGKPLLFLCCPSSSQFQNGFRNCPAVWSGELQNSFIKNKKKWKGKKKSFWSPLEKKKSMKMVSHSVFSKYNLISIIFSTWANNDLCIYLLEPIKIFFFRSLLIFTPPSRTPWTVFISHELDFAMTTC